MDRETEAQRCAQLVNVKPELAASDPETFHCLTSGMGQPHVFHKQAQGLILFMSQHKVSASALEEESSGYWQNRAEGSWSWPGTQRQGQRLAKVRLQKAAWQRAFQPVLLEWVALGKSCWLSKPQFL